MTCSYQQDCVHFKVFKESLVIFIWDTKESLSGPKESLYILIYCYAALFKTFPLPDNQPVYHISSCHTELELSQSWTLPLD